MLVVEPCVIVCCCSPFCPSCRDQEEESLKAALEMSKAECNTNSNGVEGEEEEEEEGATAGGDLLLDFSSSGE